MSIRKPMPNTGSAAAGAVLFTCATQPAQPLTKVVLGVDGFLRRSGVQRQTAQTKEAKTKATTGIEPVWTALQRVDLGHVSYLQGLSVLRGALSSAQRPKNS
jgi:hypothetical protein